jgi:flagellar protein FliO/FliZ
MEWIVAKTFLSLAAVIALMIGVVFVMKKYVYGSQGSSSNTIEMKIVGTIMLQPKRSVSVLKVMNKVLIVGVTEQGIQALGEIDDEQSLQEISETLVRKPQSKWFARKQAAVVSVSFAEALGAQLKKAVAKGV